jgi:folate-binding protein YgfZ
MTDNHPDLTGDFEASYRALRGDGGLVEVPRDILRVAGPEAEVFLQGQLSQDVAALPLVELGWSSAWSFLLQPAGKVDAWLRVTRRAEDEFVLDVDRGFGDSVRQRLVRFKLRTKADVGDVEQWRCWSMRRGTSGSWSSGGPELVVPDNWPGAPGVAFIGSRRPNLAGDVPLVSLDAYESVRIECGVPKMGAELTENTIPAEAGQWIIDESVSFTKGCYTGQELVARIDSRGGNVPRHLRGVVIDGAEPPVGAVVVVDGNEVGSLTSVSRSPGFGSFVALGYVARKVEPPAAATVRWPDGDAPARIESLPLV